MYSDVCWELDKLGKRFEKVIMEGFDELLKTVNEIKQAAPDDQELDKVLSTARTHILAWRRISEEVKENERLGAPGNTPIDITEIVQFGTYKDWVLAHGEYTLKRCFPEETDATEATVGSEQ